MKRTIVVFIALCVAALFTQGLVAQDRPHHHDGPDHGPRPEFFEGFVFTKLANIGSRDEGVAYFIQLRDYKEIEIVKFAPLFKNDKKLDAFVGKKVVIDGSIRDGKIEYTTIKSAPRPGK